MSTCAHCKMDIEIRNPSGHCDHLYYPENCKTCAEDEHNKKFPKLIEAMKGDAHVILVANPQALGDTHTELCKNLRMIYDAGKTLMIAPQDR